VLALNWRVLNWPDHGGFSNVDISDARVLVGVQTALKAM
jgi:hypothetical protein